VVLGLAAGLGFSSGCNKDPVAKDNLAAGAMSTAPAPSGTSERVPLPANTYPRDRTKTVFKVPVGDSPVLGTANALVTIVEFSDFQCTACGLVQPTLKALRDKYGEKVRLVWKHNPPSFHVGA
jgi:protein-disulfide isomerase